MLAGNGHAVVCGVVLGKQFIGRGVRPIDGGEQPVLAVGQQFHPIVPDDPGHYHSVDHRPPANP